MFERRLKIFLAIVACVACVLVVRAAQVQVLEKEHWQTEAARTRQRTQLVETFRGKILDCNGEALAVDEPCVDAVVDYRAVAVDHGDAEQRKPSDNWLIEIARQRLKSRPGSKYLSVKPDQQKLMRDAEVRAVRANLEAMWAELAKVSGKSRDEIDETRTAIVDRVQQRRRYVWYYNYKMASRKHEQNQKIEPTPAWQRWLMGESNDAPQLDQYEVHVSEETESHVVLRNISKEAQLELARYIDRFP
jgi:cell division protein FtsI/penicillin-binding protein 2